MEFWYYMYGTDIGTLRVHVKSQNGSFSPVWEVAGNKGDEWRQGRVPVGSPDTDPFQVRIYTLNTEILVSL
jgi:hypothetical protein